MSVPETKIKTFPEATQAALDALIATGEIATATLTYVDDKTGKIVSSKWNQLPQSTQAKIKGGASAFTLGLGAVGVTARSASAIEIAISAVKKSMPNTIKSINISTSSGVKLVANPNKTTTILGNYGSDIKGIINELKYPKTLDFGSKKGGFNVLNAPDDLYKNADQFWNNYNKPFLDSAIQRGDDIILATPPKGDYIKDIKTGEIRGFGKEIDYLKSKGYTYDPIANKMIK